MLVAFIFIGIGISCAAVFYISAFVGAMYARHYETYHKVCKDEGDEDDNRGEKKIDS